MSLLTRSSTVDGVLRRSAARYSDTTALIFGERTLRCRPLVHAPVLTPGSRLRSYSRSSRWNGLTMRRV